MLVVIAGPSGSGKSTLAIKLIRREKFNWLLSYTTRPKRDSDNPGEYRFLSDKAFDAMRDEGEFLWHEKPFQRTYRYASRKKDVDRALAGDDLVAVLIGSSLYTLYGLAVDQGALEEVCYLYLTIDDTAELARRMNVDKDRADVAERLKDVPRQNAEAKDSYLPYHFIDATMPAEQVYDAAIRIIEDY